MTTEKLGPCPLCGGEAEWVAAIGYSDVQCIRYDCLMSVCSPGTWQTLSALAEQNRRRGKALERCREWFRTWNHAPGDPEMLSPEALEKLCEEALK